MSNAKPRLQKDTESNEFYLPAMALPTFDRIEQFLSKFKLHGVVRMPARKDE
ncbi:hypothetical protein [Halalkalirubrum salinum]|uniref:hypothetical protein n=1 Tax=Halalkalirubrum salinum TaxID=2563889 RepID=UPI001484D7CF|nr:hypothetical protein [Halalkalirubrum salinum]